MKLISRRSTSVAVAGAVASALVLSAAGSADAGTNSTVTIRENDLSNASLTAGHVKFLKDGLSVYTDDNGSQAKAAGYFAMDKPLADVTTASLEWLGTDARPGQQIVFDVDGQKNDKGEYDWNVLVGEPVYGDNWWLTKSSTAAAKEADPSGANNDGNGTEWFGTLTEWAANMPHAHIYGGGFSLGSGIKGSGVITAITYGGTDYVFTNTDAAVVPTAVDVAGSWVNKSKGAKARLVLTSIAKPENSVLGKRLQWKVTVDGKRTFATSQQFSDRDVWVQRFAKGSGAHSVSLFKNGVEVHQFTVRTGHTK